MRNKLIKKMVGYILIAAALAAEVPISLNILFENPFSLSFVLALHFLSAVILALAFFVLTSRKTKRTEKKDNIWWIYLFIATLIIPMFGILSSLIVYAAQSTKKPLPPPIVTDEITVQGPEVFGAKRKLSRQLEVLNRLDIEPFVDIFRRGQADLKKSAVKLLGNMRTKRAVSTLMIALMDKDIEISLFAAGILSRIEDEFAIDIKNKATLYEKNSTDSAVALELVNLYLSYAEIGLLDSIARTYYYKEALKVLDNISEDPETIYLKGHIFFSMGDYQAALAQAKKCVKESPQNEKYNKLLWNTLFYIRDYKTLAKNIHTAKEGDAKNINKNILDYWT